MPSRTLKPAGKAPGEMGRRPGRARLAHQHRPCAHGGGKVFPGGGAGSGSARSGKSAGHSPLRPVPGTSGRSCAPPYQRATGYVRVYALLAGAARLRGDGRQRAGILTAPAKLGRVRPQPGRGARGRRIFPGARHGRAHTGAVRSQPSRPHPFRHRCSRARPTTGTSSVRANPINCHQQPGY